MADWNLAEEIAYDLASGELEETYSQETIMDIVTRTLEALPDFGVQIMRSILHD